MNSLVSGQRKSLARGNLRFSLASGDLELLGTRFSLVVIFLNGDRAASLAPIYALGAQSETNSNVSFDAGFTTEINLDRLPDSVSRVQAIAYVAGGPGTGVSFKDLGWIEITGSDFRFRIDLGNCGHSTLHLIDAYRHEGGWRLLANGQGFIGGLGVIGSRIGVHLDSGHGIPDPPPSAPRGDDRRTGGNPAPSGGTASGSGFAVSPNHVLTNHHVIEHARAIEINGASRAAAGRVIFSDSVNDLALVETDVYFEHLARFREGVHLLLGEDVILIGFPLQNLLGQGPQVTTGNVSGLCGFANNSAVMQYSAPTSSGSSGGPILDQSGLVIGVVRAGLAHDEIRNAGSVSENINFGVKGAVARAFLDAAGLSIETSVGSAPRNRAEIVREARAYASCIKVSY